MPLTREQFRRAREAGKSVDEIIEFENRSKPSVSTLTPSPGLPREAEVQRLISKRTGPVETLRKEIETPFEFRKHPFKSTLKIPITGAKFLGIPVSRASAAIGGFGLGLQKQKGFKESFKMGREGLLGEKEFRAFDPIRKTGVLPDIVTDIAEVATEIAVSLKALSGIGKILRGPIQKLSDKKLLKIGRDLVKSTDDAVTATGKPLTKAYQPINQLSVKTDKVLNEVADLEPQIVRHLEKEIGQNIDEFMENFTIEKARQLKGALAKLKPASFGKEARGAIDTVIDKQVSRTYSSIKKSMQETLDTQGLKKAANKLLKADEDFEDTINASRFIKRTITDPLLKKPTRVGRVAGGIEREGDVTTRSALNKLRESNIFVKQRINNIVDGLEEFNKIQKRKRFVGQVGQSVLRGVVVGGTVGRILGERE